MPFVTEMFDMEKYPHVDALLANCQGVFLNSVRPRFLRGVQGYLFIYLFNWLRPIAFFFTFYLLFYFVISFIDFLHYVTSHHIKSHRIASLHYICLVPRRLSFDENVRAKEGGLASAMRKTKRLRRRLALQYISSH